MILGADRQTLTLYVEMEAQNLLTIFLIMTVIAVNVLMNHLKKKETPRKIGNGTSNMERLYKTRDTGRNYH